jgi:hypothetical protein
MEGNNAGATFYRVEDGVQDAISVDHGSLSVGVSVGVKLLHAQG